MQHRSFLSCFWLSRALFRYGGVLWNFCLLCHNNIRFHGSYTGFRQCYFSDTRVMTSLFMRRTFMFRHYGIILAINFVVSPYNVATSQQQVSSDKKGRANKLLAPIVPKTLTVSGPKTDCRTLRSPQNGILYARLDFFRFHVVTLFYCQLFISCFLNE